MNSKEKTFFRLNIIADPQIKRIYLNNIPHGKKLISRIINSIEKTFFRLNIIADTHLKQKKLKNPFLLNIVKIDLLFISYKILLEI